MYTLLEFQTILFSDLVESMLLERCSKSNFEEISHSLMPGESPAFSLFDLSNAQHGCHQNHFVTRLRGNRLLRFCERFVTPLFQTKHQRVGHLKAFS